MKMTKVSDITSTSDILTATLERVQDVYGGRL